MSRFEETDNGTVLDHETGLEWQAEPEGPMDWYEAMDYAESLDLGGYNDWRVPTVEELETLLDCGQYFPASAFPGMTNDAFWSSSVNANYTSYAWYVIFNVDYAYNVAKSYTGHVRCVRRKMKEQA